MSENKLKYQTQLDYVIKLLAIGLILLISGSIVDYNIGPKSQPGLVLLITGGLLFFFGGFGTIICIAESTN